MPAKHKPGAKAASAVEPRTVQARTGLAKNAWEHAIADMYNPAVPEPEFTFSLEYQEPFYIDVNDWTVHLNLAQVPALSEEKFSEFVRSISHHELAHYTICPYDGVTNALMIQAAQRVLGQVHAPLACNVFADLVIEAELSARFKDLTAWRFQESVRSVVQQVQQEPSNTWKLIVLAEADITGIAVPPDISSNVDFAGVKVNARKIAAAVRKALHDQNAWPATTARVARIMKPYLADEFPVAKKAGVPDPSSNWRDVPGLDGVQVQVPGDVLEQAGDVTKVSDRDNGRMNEKALKRMTRNRGGKRNQKQADPGAQDQIKGAEKILVELAKRAKGFGEFGGPAVSLGIVRQEQALAAWYRSRAAGLIRVEVKVRKDTGLLPVSPTTWRIGEPVESLDLTLTLLASPVIIPDLTTRRWDLQLQQGLSPSPVCPDFLIVIDSSHSMRWHPETARGEYDTALVAAFAAVHVAKRKGVCLAAINFSGDVIACPWTRDTEQVENVLLDYLGDGTVLPTPDIIEMAGKAGGPVLVFIISDAGLHDWQGSIPPLMRLVDQHHHVTMFLIGGKAQDLHQKRFQAFMARGGKIHVISDATALVGLVVSEIQETYGERTNKVARL
jgi:hypothetical protein